MKKVITPVGLSVFTNFFHEQPNRELQEVFDRFNKNTLKYCASTYPQYEERIADLRDEADQFAEQEQDASAEITSLLKIRKHVEQDIEVYLLTTDTILSKVAADIIQSYFKEKKHDGISIKNIATIPSLQVEDVERFTHSGLGGLITQIYTIANGYYDNLIFDMTGGYKAIIPYLTLMAQVHRIPTYYVFEDAKDKQLIEIPLAPIEINWNFFDVYSEQFALFESVDSDQFCQKQDFPYTFLEEAQRYNCIEVVGADVVLHPIGNIFWKKYTSNHFVFYAPDDVWQEIQQQSHITRLLRQKFSYPELVDAKTEIKGEHIVYDDGNNDYRIYYFRKGKIFYIYKTFESEEKARKYIQQPINKQKIITTSKLRKLKLKEESYV